MESTILNFGLEDQDYSLNTIPLFNSEYCFSCVYDKDLIVQKHATDPSKKGSALKDILPKSLSSNYHETLLSGPLKQRFKVGDTWAYLYPIKGTSLTYLTIINKDSLRTFAIVESVDTLLSILILLSILVLLAHWVIRKEFITPSQTLVSYLSAQSDEVPPASQPTINSEWKPWLNTISKVFKENRALIARLTDNIRNLDAKVLARTQVIQEKNQSLEDAFDELKSAQNHIILQEKMASLGSLTAGIAHEMKNPLNFIINFSDVSQELMSELLEDLAPLIEQSDPATRENIHDLKESLTQNMQFIREHGQRADHIIRSMLVHARGENSEFESTNLSALLAENIELAISGFKGNYSGFGIQVSTSLDENIDTLFLQPSEIGRVIINIINNACYAMWQKKSNLKGDQDYDPKLSISSRDLDEKIEIRIRDNGPGLPENIKEKIFEPFFTTKPSGQGTGLGLSLCYEIVTTHHQGNIDISSEQDKFTEFIITLPKTRQAA